MCKENCVVSNKRYKKIPPDGGWGYMICVAVIINYCVTIMFVGSFGIIYKEFMEQQNMTSKTVTLLCGINVMLAAISAFLTSALLQVVSIRMAALIASCLFNAGILCTVFNFGTGILISTSYISVNDYFLEKRLLAMSLTQTCSAAAGMLAPELVDICLRSLGYRDTLIVISAISLHTFVAVTMMQPVSRHLLKVEIENVVDEMVLLVGEKPTVDVPVTTPTIKLTDTDSPFEVENTEKGEMGKMVLLVGEKPTVDVPVTTPTIKLTDTDSPFEVENTEKGEMGSKKTYSEFFDVAKKFFVSIVSMGPCYCLFAENIFSVMLPQALYSWYLTEAQTAHAISLISLGELITKALFVLTSKWLTKLGHQEVYVAFVFLAFVARIILLWTKSVTAMMIFLTVIGIARCGIYVLPPLILADYFGSAQFAKAFGLYLLVTGIMDMILGPTVGAIRDLANSYSTAFYVITCGYLIVVVLWIVKFIYKKNKHRRVAQKIAVKKN